MPNCEKCPAVQVDLEHLRNGFWWLMGHNWQWLTATKDQDVIGLLEALLAAYRDNLDGAERGVPTVLFDGATPVASEDVSLHLPGPADAAQATSSESDDDSASKVGTEPNAANKYS